MKLLKIMGLIVLMPIMVSASSCSDVTTTKDQVTNQEEIQLLSSLNGPDGSCANIPLKYKIIVPYLYDPSSQPDENGKRLADRNAEAILAHNRKYFEIAINFFNDQLAASAFGGIGDPL